MRQFIVGRGSGGFAFDVDRDGWVRAVARPDGTIPVIGGQVDLQADISRPATWSDIEERTGNNERISDGAELYPSASFDRSLIKGQVHDVLWALQSAGSMPAGGRLLEVGCGPGFLLEELGQELPNWSMTGVDPSPDSSLQGRSRGVDVQEGTLDSLDLPVGEFDAAVVMGNFQLHHDPAATLRRLAEVSRPGSVLYLDTKNPRSSTRLLARWLVQVPLLGELGSTHSFAAHAFHGLRHGIPRAALLRLLVSTGWEPAKVRTVGPRLLRFGNEHGFSRGIKGALWRGLDAFDGVVDERAWLQVAARRAS